MLWTLYTGDLVYLDTLFAYYPSTDPEAYLDSLELIAALPARRGVPISDVDNSVDNVEKPSGSGKRPVESPVEKVDKKLHRG